MIPLFIKLAEFTHAFGRLYGPAYAARDIRKGHCVLTDLMPATDGPHSCFICTICETIKHFLIFCLDDVFR